MEEGWSLCDCPLSLFVHTIPYSPFTSIWRWWCRMPTPVLKVPCLFCFAVDLMCLSINLHTLGLLVPVRIDDGQGVLWRGADPNDGNRTFI